MNWGTIFGRVILDRGRAYYDAGKVKNLRYENGTYLAMVRGSLPYRVEIRVEGNTIRSMSCNCSRAESGQRCKHMAATLIAIERQRAQAKLRQRMNPTEANSSQVDGVVSVIKEPDGPETPFPKRERPEGEYWYYDLSHMTSRMRFTKNQCRQARELVENGTVVLDGVIINHMGWQQESDSALRSLSKAVGSVKEKNRSYEVEITFDRERILSARCDVPYCTNGNYGRFWNHVYHSSRGPDLCVHETALLYLLADYVKKYNPGDTTDGEATRLLEHFRGIYGPGSWKNWESGRQLELTPRLELTADGWRVGFRIGNEQPYLVKNMTELVDCVRNRREKVFGTRLQADFARDTFTERSQKIYEFIEAAVLEQKYRTGDLYDEADGDKMRSLKGSMDLHGARWDEFYELFADQTLEFQDISGIGVQRGEIHLQEKLPRFQLTIQPDRDASDVFQGVRVSGIMPQLWEGARGLYYREADYLYRVPRRQVADVLPFYEMARDGKLMFRVGRKHLTEFYYTALPVLEKYGTVRQEEAEEIAFYLPPEVSFAFYLDAEDKNVTCQARAIYGDQVVSVLDGLKNAEGTLKEDYRDAGREGAVIDLLLQYFPQTDEARDLFHSGGSEDAVYDLLERGLDQLLSVGEVQSTDAFRRLNVRRRTKLSVGVSVKSDIMDLEISSEDISKEELMEILQSYRKKKRFYRLKNGDFLNMDDENIQMLDQLMQDLRLSPKEFVKGKMQIPAYRALYLDHMLETSETLYADRDSHFKKLVKEFKTVGDADFAVPKHLHGVLRKYQKVGYRWLRTLDAYGFGGILADDMGLGKTLQLISVLVAHKEEGGTGTSLIICPASLVYNWQEEFRRFAPELTVSLIVGTQPERAEKIRGYQESDVLITSYDLLKRDIAEYEDCCFAYQVLDEAQYIKNHSTAASKAVKVIRSRTRYALTGTPIENRLSELWSIFDYLMPGFLYGYDTFKKELEKPITRQQNEDATSRLKQMVAPFILRRLKQQVLKDLPDKLEETRYAHLEDRQQQLYDAQVLHMRSVLESQSEEHFRQNKIEILAELMKIRQICCDPALCLEEYDGGSAKREACLDLITSAIEGEHKMLVFSQFTSMLELLEKDLAERKISYYKITGATPKEIRMELVRQFNEDATPVFLISLKAGGTGLNLTGADVVIHYDPWWNLAVQNQATDRAHRIGQKKAVSVYKLIVKDSIEEKILHMQEAKQNLADEILSGETSGLASLTREELLQLIQG
ncbi:MAG: SNF2 helicase associated domain-containing protein [Lachnospiraceae bacterium]|nr:SNF2 helicase associated domain-containing protein [Lachnospiraceae bacterium]